MKNPTVKIAILVIPECTASVVYGLYDLLLSTSRDWQMITEGKTGIEPIEVFLVARHADEVRISNDVKVTPHYSLDECPSVDVICVPEVNLPPDASLEGRYNAELAWLRERHRQGTQLASTCSGSILFAEAGLLDGLDATTHWAWCDAMSARYPHVTVHAQRALVATGEGQRLIMAGGGTSWLDMALYLIARTVGVEEAMQVARINLIDWHQIGQQPFARLARTRQVEDALMAQCQQWIAEHYQERNPVAGMAHISGLPERTFKRRFQQATGMSPLQYVHTLRLEQAKQLLETTELSVDAIANECGYEDAGFFIRLFRREVNLTPAQYRKRFGHMRSQLSQSQPGQSRLNESGRPVARRADQGREVQL